MIGEYPELSGVLFHNAQNVFFFADDFIACSDYRHLLDVSRIGREVQAQISLKLFHNRLVVDETFLF